MEKRDALRLARQGADLTQGELAKKARVNRSKLSLYETGLIELSEAELTRVERVLNAMPRKMVPLSSLAGGSELRAIVGPGEPERAASEKYSRKLLRQQARLSQQELSRMTGIARSKLSGWESRKIELSESETNKVLDVLWERAKQDPYAELERTHEAATELFKSNREMRKRLEAVEAKNAALAKEVAALREWYDAMEKAALAHARVEESSEKSPVEKESDE